MKMDFLPMEIHSTEETERREAHFKDEIANGIENAEEKNGKFKANNWKEELAWGQALITDSIYKGITMITGIILSTQDILDLSSRLQPIACITIATGHTKKMKLLHNLESVGTKVAALYGTGKWHHPAKSTLPGCSTRNRYRSLPWIPLSNGRKTQI